jgi:hypothetical protein
MPGRIGICVFDGRLGGANEDSQTTRHVNSRDHFVTLASRRDAGIVALLDYRNDHIKTSGYATGGLLILPSRTGSCGSFHRCY